ncbi:distal tail protein Dit [Limosilactobacillus fermentum]|uniref:distal tail protein Dit n=1 Tax=Limosilactobacillus fermentum TaxID=1613 RepID=UPI002458D628|nr:distal tail protein Dit [Limosilactobacillus fermentum]MDH5017587.1 phage tail family protein [Limosilactobacillus fermentum]
MYDFRDIDIDRRIREPDYPAEMVSYGGHWLDQEVTGFRTLASTGRHEFTRQVNATDRAGDGATYLSSRLEARKIEVGFYLVATTITEFNERVARLKQILATPNQPIVFHDDPTYHFTGTVTGLTFDEPTLSTKGKIEFSLQDPFARSAVIKREANGNSVAVSNDGLVYQQTPKRLIFTPTSQVAALVITCGSSKIELNVGVPGGQPVEVDFDKLEVTINWVLSLEAVTLDSNIGDFWITDGSIIEFNASGKIELDYEVMKL